jgi:hypothetical protein
MLVSEEVGSAKVQINISSALDEAIEIFYLTKDKNATSGEDYITRVNSVTIDSSDTSATVDVRIIDDEKVELSESFEVVPFKYNYNGQDVEVGLEAVGEVTIEGEIQKEVKLSVDNAGRREDRGSVAVNFHINDTLKKDLVIHYSTADVSARSGSDYFGGSGTVTIKKGETERNTFYKPKR